MRRLAESENITAMVMNVSMPEASYLNGEEIRVAATVRLKIQRLLSTVIIQ